MQYEMRTRRFGRLCVGSSLITTRSMPFRSSRYAHLAARAMRYGVECLIRDLISDRRDVISHDPAICVSVPRLQVVKVCQIVIELGVNLDAVGKQTVEELLVARRTRKSFNLPRTRKTPTRWALTIDEFQGPPALQRRLAASRRWEKVHVSLCQQYQECFEVRHDHTAIS
jgi:hypothetical protein